MDGRLPYYMAYPMPLLYDDEKIEKRDFEYLKSLYPVTAKKLLPYVENECERMEYEGSAIYDEYPDQLQIRLLCSRIYDKAKDDISLSEEAKTEAQLRDLVQLVLFHELFRRRSSHRRNRTKFWSIYKSEN